MKLKEFFYILGIKPKVKQWGYKIKNFQLSQYGAVEYAQWLHPSEAENKIEEDVLKGLSSFLDTGDFCIDIGAHTGDTTIPIALCVGKTGCVLALEPNKFVYPVLEKNANLNLETMEFEYSDSGFCNGGLHKQISKWKHGHAFKLEVVGVNLLKILKKDYHEELKRLKFIKIDTEGYDLFVIKSLNDLVNKFHPYMKVEIYKHTTCEYREELYALLSSKGYTIYKVTNDNNLMHYQITKNDLMNWKHYDIFCVPHKQADLNVSSQPNIK